MNDATNAAQRLQTNCVDAWDWSYVEGSSLADGNIQQDIAAVLEENRRLREACRVRPADAAFAAISRQTDAAMDELEKAARESFKGE